MRVKVIDKKKVKILIESKDIEELSVPENITDLSNDKVKEFILMLLGEIYIQTGLNFLFGKICVEVVQGTSSSFYIIITALDTEKTVTNLPVVKADEDMYLFELYQPENIFDVSSVLNNQSLIKTGETTLYKYKTKYYLAVNFPPDSVSSPLFPDMLCKLSEHCHKCRWNILNEAFLCEWGEVIAKDPVKNI